MAIIPEWQPLKRCRPRQLSMTIAEVEPSPRRKDAQSGLYKLVIRSDKEEAKGFQDWVTKDALPTIRKDCAYIKDEGG